MSKDELELTVETLINLDEPEALLATLRRAAERRKGARWRALAEALEAAENELAAFNATTPRPEPVDSEAKPE